MKALKFVLVLFSFVGLMLVGCADESQSPNAPLAQGSLEKNVVHYYTAMDWPTAPPQGGIIRTIPGGKIQFKEVKVFEDVLATDTRVSGKMEHFLSTMIDAETGEGSVHGSFTIFPVGAGDNAKWEGTYEGYRSYNGKTFVDIPNFLPYPDGTYDNWTLTLKLEGHGKGGIIDGYQMFSEHALTIINFADDPTNYPFPMPQFWFGNGSGFYKEH